MMNYYSEVGAGQGGGSSYELDWGGGSSVGYFGGEDLHMIQLIY